MLVRLAVSALFLTPILATGSATAQVTPDQAFAGAPGVTIGPGDNQPTHRTSFDPRPPKIVLGSPNVATPSALPPSQPLVPEGPTPLDLRPRVDPAQADSYLNSHDFHDLTAARSSRRESGPSQLVGAAGAMGINATILTLDQTPKQP